MGTQTKFKVELLPPAVREEIDKGLITRDFHNSHKLAADIRARGFDDVGDRAMLRYARKLQRERKAELLELARTSMAAELEAAHKRRKLALQ
ncbi:MAG: phage protein Gp27 family protein [Candidatus Binataceae bacterium]